jgi:IPT/TIG domain
MKIVRIVLFALVAALPLVAQTSSPTRGTTTGGDLITITNAGQCTDGCPAPRVQFGGVLSPRVVVHAGYVTAITPPHSAGTVQVTVDPIGPVGTFTYVPSGSIIDPNYERVLIPLSLGTGQFPGAYGSLWASEIWIHNANPFASEVLFGNPDCTSCGLNQPVINAGELRDARYIAANGVPFGLIAWTQKGAEGGLTFSLQVRDVSRAKLHSGTEMPVIYESQFRDSITLLNVPIEPASSRSALRIFNLDAANQLPVRIVIRPVAGGDPLVDDTIYLRIAGFGGVVPSFARYTSVDDLAARYPQLAGAGNVWITVTTPDASKIWAFAAVTNNDTQLITTVVPH